MLGSSKASKFICFMLIFLIILQFVPYKAHSTYSNPLINETLTIDQLYDNSVFTVKVSSYNFSDILNLTQNYGNYIDYYILIVSNLNLNNQTLSWFLTQNPEINFLDFLSEKNLILIIDYKNFNLNIPKEIIDYVDSILKTNFINIENRSSMYVYSAPADYNSYIDYFLQKFKQYKNGFLNITYSLHPSLLVYKYVENGLDDIYSVGIASVLNSTIISNQTYFILNYSRLLGTISPSPYSNKSYIEINLFGMQAISSNPKIPFFNSYSNGYVSSGKILLDKDTSIRDFYINASLINPFLIIQQIANPAITNSTLNLQVLLRNIGTLKASNVTVKLSVPNNFEGPRTIYFGDIKPNGFLTKNITYTIVSNEPNVYYLQPPVATLKVGETNLTFIGNPIYVAYKVSKFASLSLSIEQINLDYLTSIKNRVSFLLNITNSGNTQASNVSIQIDYYRSFLKAINASQSFILNVTLYLNRFNELPTNASLFNQILLSYLSENTTYRLNLTGNLFNSMLNYGYTTYASFRPYPVNSVFNSTFDLIFSYEVIGGSGNVSLKIPMIALKNLTITKPIGLPIINNSYVFSFSLISGSKSSISFSFRSNSINTFYLTPIYEEIRLSKYLILLPTSVFTNGINIVRDFNTTNLQIGGKVKLEIRITNFATTPIYNLNIITQLYKGWEIISGNKVITLNSLSSHSTYSAILFLNASKPTSPYIPPTLLSFEIGNLTFSESTNKSYIKVFMQFSFKAVNIYSNNLNNFTVRVYSLGNNLIANLTSINGIANWNGYLGVFNVQVSFKGIVVFSNQLNLTADNSTITLITNVTSIKIIIADVFGQQIQNAYITIEGPFAQQAEKSQSEYILDNLPFGSYTLNIQIEGKEYNIPIFIDQFTPRQIKINLPIIYSLGYAVSLQLFALIIFIAFLIVTFIAFYRIKKTKSITSATRK
jgi:hypothetical protein